MIKIYRIKCGNVNCYIIEENGKAILVDTARTKHREKILKVCQKVNVQGIILTHTHMDHCQNAAFLSQQLNVPIAICKLDEELIQDNMLQPLYAKTILGKLILSFSEKAFHQDKIPLFTPEIFLKDGDTLSFWGINAKIIALPGHTNGSIGIELGKDAVIVGDALMNMFYPTVSMLYHNYEQMISSAKIIGSLGKRKIYFGHGSPRKNCVWAK